MGAGQVDRGRPGIESRLFAARLPDALSYGFGTRRCWRSRFRRSRRGATPIGGLSSAAQKGLQAVRLLGKPFVTVSPVSGALPNNGADFGPDTPGTKTSGIQEAVTEALEAAGELEIQLLPGTFKLSTLAGTYHSAINIDSGKDITTGAPVVVRVRGSGGSGFASEEGAGSNATVGSTIIDATACDVLAAGSNTQGRVFFVPPPPTATANVQALALDISDLTIILPVYNQYGSGPGHVVNGSTVHLVKTTDAIPSSVDKYGFINGIDAYCASSLRARRITVLDTVGAAGPVANKGIARGTQCGIVFPNGNSQGQLAGYDIATWNLFVGVMGAPHLVMDRFYPQACLAALYDWQGGHCGYIGYMNPQGNNWAFYHAVLPTLSSGFSYLGNDPVGDLYTPTNTGPPSHALADGGYVVEMFDWEGASDPTNGLLLDDSSYPMNLIVTIHYTGAPPANGFGLGARVKARFLAHDLIPTNQPNYGFNITTPPVPASGTPYVNSYAVPVRIYILTAGTTTAYTITDPVGNSQTFAVALVAGQEITLDPGASITITYSTPPIWKWYGTVT